MPDSATAVPLPLPSGPVSDAAAQLLGMPERERLLALLRLNDPVLQVWALERLLAGDDLTFEVLRLAMTLAPQSAFLRQLLHPVLLQACRFDLAARLRELEEKAGSNQARKKLLQAQMANDAAGQLAALETLYLETGDVKLLCRAAELARRELGWHAAWEPVLRVLLSGAEPPLRTATAMLRLLRKEDRREVFLHFGTLVEKLAGCKPAELFLRAQALFWEGQYAACEALIKDSGVAAGIRGNSVFHNLLAACCEKQGRYQEAAQHYREQNASNANPRHKAGDFLAEVRRQGELPIPELPADPNTGHFVLTGFPRSGTTLLENVLDSHPLIATCEETSAFSLAYVTAYRTPLQQDRQGNNLTLRAQLHRQFYYRALDRHAGKPGVKVVIDKTPILSAHIRYLEKLFPAKRYLFALRHPYDVALSNFRQEYQSNLAMAAFSDFQATCELYARVMGEWFAVFPGPSERVHYVRYEELVTDFDNVVRAALDFLGVDWNDEVRHFAEKSEQRAVRTPSYAKVRQGLGLGVQTAWRNYRFLFDEHCSALLDPWVERFGYSLAEQ